ncbi:hypothetical protein [Halothiobacillus sp. DCM-1]|uniref:hypothetical protein n=1 Tax=Halothiobacillus sp. DCM-1 TaxID=3112558 RepID=UPI003250BBA3
MILLDLSVIFTRSGEDLLTLYEALPEVLRAWQQQSIPIVGLSPSAEFTTAWRALWPQAVIQDSANWASWRLPSAWQALCTAHGMRPTDCVLYTRHPAWLNAATQASITAYGILRDAHTMAALPGTWFAELPNAP